MVEKNMMVEKIMEDIDAGCESAHGEIDDIRVSVYRQADGDTVALAIRTETGSLLRGRVHPIFQQFAKHPRLKYNREATGEPRVAGAWFFLFKLVKGGLNESANR